jgi:catechol 2,3-dioxygenase-like lactoylglutathione lyase family enzyme
MGRTTMRFAYTYLFVPDVDEAVRFYRDAFGLQIRTPPQNGESAIMGSFEHGLGIEAFRIAPLRAPFEEFQVSGPPAGFYLVLSVEDLDRALARASAAGCQVISGPEGSPHGNVFAFVKDPHGVVVELCQFPSQGNDSNALRRALLAAAAALTLLTGAALAVAYTHAVADATSRAAATAAPLLLAAWCLLLGAVAGRSRVPGWSLGGTLKVACAVGGVAAAALAAWSVFLLAS